MKKRRDDIHETPDVTYIRNPEVAHEASDVDVKGILKFTLFLVFLFVFAFLAIKGLYLALERREERQELKSPPGPMALTEKERLPPEPRLQAAPGFGDDLDLSHGENLELKSPQAEYEVLSARWKEILEKGQRDPQTGAVTALPIEEAMKQLVQEGLPSRPTGEKQQSYERALEMPSYSSSGRMMELSK
jgi:hypothetical protein